MFTLNLCINFAHCIAEKIFADDYCLNHDNRWKHYSQQFMFSSGIFVWKEVIYWCFVNSVDDMRQMTAVMQFLENYPTDALVVELKSKTLTEKLLDGVVKVCDIEARKYTGQKQVCEGDTCMFNKFEKKILYIFHNFEISHFFEISPWNFTVLNLSQFWDFTTCQISHFWDSTVLRFHIFAFHILVNEISNSLDVKLLRFYDFLNLAYKMRCKQNNIEIFYDAVLYLIINGG